jgi:hypothetical protein
MGLAERWNIGPRSDFMDGGRDENGKKRKNGTEEAVNGNGVKPNEASVEICR